MSMMLERSDGLMIKTYPTWVLGKDQFLLLDRTGVEQSFVSSDFAMAEIDYTLGEIMSFRPEARTAVTGFMRYLASLKPQVVELPLVGQSTYFGASEEFRGFSVPELPTATKVDWCGVVVDPTDFLFAAQYVLTNTPVEAEDPRLAFIEALQGEV